MHAIQRQVMGHGTCLGCGQVERSVRACGGDDVVSRSSPVWNWMDGLLRCMAENWMDGLLR